jgi:hypothetical protein
MNPNGGYYDTDRGHATSYGGAASIFGLSVSGQTGYTSNIYVDLVNDSSLREYACGNDYLPDAPILWSNNQNGV